VSFPSGNPAEIVISAFWPLNLASSEDDLCSVIFQRNVDCIPVIGEIVIKVKGTAPSTLKSGGTRTRHNSHE